MTNLGKKCKIRRENAISTDTCPIFLKFGTDTCDVMRDEAQRAFPNARSLLCAWHVIERTTARKLGPIIGTDVWKQVRSKLWKLAKTTHLSVVEKVCSKYVF